ncbi:MAG TPA: PEP-CTERM sorting domain-containing protein [Terriglobales bacterium]|nr:PEP-CTERM sorting domain-containing protein [Terriglobales bacterium]
MKKFLLRALAVVPILLLVTSFASANSSMQLVFDSTVIAPITSLGCGANNFCSQQYMLVDGTVLTVSTNTGNGGGPPNNITLTTNTAGAFPGGPTIEIDYAVNNDMGNGADFQHAFGGTLFGSQTATNNILFNSANGLGFTGTLVDALTVGSGGASFLASSANSSGAFNFAPSPYTLVDQIVINDTTGLLAGQAIQETSAFAIPEPASLMLLGGGFLGLANILRRKLAK